uniref:(northern house mosquito) hypothetical protein n=1 Tax=Culex pipiens TaxID=7175 RepID=A0A8D8ER22_CULPI
MVPHTASASPRRILQHTTGVDSLLSRKYDPSVGGLQPAAPAGADPEGRTTQPNHAGHADVERRVDASSPYRRHRKGPGAAGNRTADSVQHPRHHGPQVQAAASVCVQHSRVGGV